MAILDFLNRYPDEASCKEEFKKYRLSEGVRCKKCGHTEHYWKKKREEWECKRCSHRTTMKSGSVMENSKLPYRYWFIAMHLLTCTKKSISEKEIQRELGHKRYQPVWEMLHKLRSVMGLRDDEYQLSNEVELNDGFFETVSITSKKAWQLKRGRGSQRQTTVLVMAESQEVDEGLVSKQYKHNKSFKFLKMKVINGGFKQELFTSQVEKTLKKTPRLSLTDPPVMLV